MIDVQNTEDFREIDLDSVGICDLQIQINICGEPSLANISLGVSLNKSKKGIHMSRLASLIDEFTELNNATISNLLKNACECQNAYASECELHTSFFCTKSAPVSNLNSKMNYHVYIKASFFSNAEVKIFHTLDIPITSVCPCSKSISEYGAHNQRGVISVTLDDIDVYDYTNVIRIVETSAPSHELYTILKRPDEKYVTEQAYDNPKFVEDLVRDALIGLNNSYSDKIISVKAKNYESIHNHNVYANIIIAQ